jgi:hypothetical protein
MHQAVAVWEKPRPTEHPHVARVKKNLAVLEVELRGIN